MSNASSPRPSASGGPSPSSSSATNQLTGQSVRYAPYQVKKSPEYMKQYNFQDRLINLILKALDIFNLNS